MIKMQSMPKWWTRRNQGILFYSLMVIVLALYIGVFALDNRWWLLLPLFLITSIMAIIAFILPYPPESH